MKNILANIFGKMGIGSQTMSKEAIAKLLRMSPEALAAFESAYDTAILSQPPENFFSINSRQAACDKHSIDASEDAAEAEEGIEELQNRIVAELLAHTAIYVFDGNLGKKKSFPALPDGVAPVTNEDISALPMAIRPQLSGNLMKVDIAEKSYPHLLWYYGRYQTAKTQAQRMDAYHHFRQGLDILDLDPVMYEIIGTNPNSMGHWLPKLVNACAAQDFFKIPATTVAKVPMTLLQLTRQEYGELTHTTLNIVDQWAHEAFGLNDEKEYFIKTGTYSSKFDFRNGATCSATGL